MNCTPVRNSLLSLRRERGDHDLPATPIAAPSVHPSPTLFTLSTFWTSMVICLSAVLLLLRVVTFTRATPTLSLLGITQCTVATPWGLIKGHETELGACRFAIKYATSNRWESSQAYTSVNFDSSALPPACPQPTTYLGDLEQSEDCLYAVVYVPKGLKPIGGLPVYVWLHGGSFTYGSASQAGLDGSSMAVHGNMVVVFIQYRLGVLGLLPPSKVVDPNLAVQDVVLGLESIRQRIGAFGGDSGQVTIGGQSSGGTMVRALLANRRAMGVFRAVIIQSDPMNYGFAKQETTKDLQSAFYASQPFSSCKDMQCMRNLPAADIVAAQTDFLNIAPGLAEGVPLALPLRPTFGTSSVSANTVSAATNNPSSLSSRPSNIPMLLTSTANEAGTLVQSLLQAPQTPSNASYSYLLSSLAGTDRAQQIIASQAYALPSTDGFGKSGDDFRGVVERVGTDLAWRCASREFARAWGGAGGQVWVAEWQKGINYLSNANGGYCEGKVCHEDDLFPTFGSSPKPDASAKELHKDVVAYWSAFIHHLDPNSTGPRRHFQWLRNLFHPHKKAAAPSLWHRYSNDGDILALGGGQVIRCPQNLWGRTIKWDWQLYG